MTVARARGVRNGTVLSLDELRLPVTSPALRHGLGVFETVAVRNGRPFLLGVHAARLVGALGRCGWRPPWNPRTVWRWGMLAVTVGGRRDGVLRLIASAEGPSLFAWVEEAPPRTQARDGLRAALRPSPRAPGSPLTGLKALSWADHALIRGRVRSEGFDEALLVAPDGTVLEGTSTNLFLVEPGRLVTPPETVVLPGVTRGLVLRLAAGLSLAAVEEPVTEARLFAAGEAFLTNTLIGIAPLVAVEGRPIGAGRPGPVTERVGRSWLSLAE